LRNPDVVVLDEASARLDPVSERRLHFAMSRLVEGRTAVIIAHRLDTLALTDDIAVISAGQLVEFGRRIDLAGDPNSHLASLLRTDTAEAVQ
jgi:ATP-binding cassette subfamily B protein/ATP-binding cassette subfamily C protein